MRQLRLTVILSFFILHPTVTRAFINASQLSAEHSGETQQPNMLLSNQMTFVRMLLRLCISNVQCVLSEVMRRVFSGWMRVNIQPKRPELRSPARGEVPTPSSVNYHFTRQCNYKCGFCFHTAKTSFVLPIDEAKRGLGLLKEAGRWI